MGVIKFVVPRRDQLPADVTDRLYMAGMDEVPWRSRAQWTDTALVVERSENDSGCLYVPCAVAGHGELVLPTASLMERTRPYHLMVELARGTLNRLRNHIAAFDAIGLPLPAAVRVPLSEAHGHLCVAATHQNEQQPAADRALAALHSALVAVNLLSDAYVEHVLNARHAQIGKLHTVMAANLGSLVPSEAMARQLLPGINAAVVPLSWRDTEAREGKIDWTRCDQQIEWCRANGLRICGGPLLQIDNSSLPDWMYLWGEDDIESFRSCVSEHIERVVDRYKGRVQLWLCGARLNRNNDFKQPEDERLRLAALAIETIRRVDPRAPIVLMIDSPWGAYMSREDYDLSPLQFADALVRADLGLSGIGLEMNLGYTAGTEPRDAMEFSRQIERFGTLGLPLLVSLCAPSSAGVDPLARINTSVVNYSAVGAPSGATQRGWARRYLPVLLSKPQVQGIVWNQLTDSQPHAFPHGGLFDDKDGPKPVMELLRALRKQHLV